MEKSFKIYTYVDGTNDTLFPNAISPVEIFDFSYDAKTMGGAPSISASVKYPVCLDNVWTGKEYVTFNGEKYFIKQTPSSSLSNDDIRYKHDIEFVSERIILDNTYFFDVVTDPTDNDKYVSNSSKVDFYGDINEFAKRLDYSLKYSKVGYTVVVDAGVSSEAKMMSFEDQFFSQVLQSIFEVYEIAYYYVGKVIHIGFPTNAITHVFKQGANGTLLSINKTNANYKIINRITGVGSTDNIPYYYPNPSDDRAAIEAAGGTWITPSANLMPPIYRESKGAERFYNAKNKTYIDPETGEYYVFENEYVDGNPKEHKVTFDYIKPTIKETVNAAGLRIDMFDRFDYDTNDNDEVDSEGNYIHPYFFGRLRKFDGTNGFNLFEHAIDKGEMTISMTSGSCGGCNFTIMVDPDTQKNTVQVHANGELLRDKDGNVIVSGAPQRQQNNTKTDNVWIALKKDVETFGVIMPNATNNYRPTEKSDMFVILHIDLPQSYITTAENKLKEEIIKYLATNNTDKFNFSINLSRIFFAENPDVLSELNENSRVQLEYDSKRYEFYISSYSYKMSANEPLPQITIELTETLTINKGTLQTSIDSVKQDIMSSIGSVDFVKQGLKYFIRKDIKDYAKFVTFREGIDIANFESLLSGGTFRTDSEGKSYLEVDRLYVRLKAIFDNLEIKKTTYIGGEQISSLASMKCIKVEDREDIIDPETGEVTGENIWDYYRCYYLKDQEGTKIKNEFKVGDQAISRETNLASGSNIQNRYYWRLVVAIGDGYIDLSKDDRDPASDDAPIAGDDIVQLGNRDDVTRQKAIIQSTVAEDAPSIKLLAGINSFSLEGKAIISQGFDGINKRAKFSVFGETYIGNADGSSFIKYTPENGVEINAKLSVGTTIGNGKTLMDAISDAEQNAIDTANENLTNYSAQVTRAVNDLQDQIDGAIESFFKEYDPTLTNEPANGWETDAEKERHGNDTFTNTLTGKSWRWVKTGTNWGWTPIADTATEKALAAAAKAQDTADGKRKVFVRQPLNSEDYDIGDLWVDATYSTLYSNDILRCKTAKKVNEAFNIAHWELASKYTDDAKAEQALNEIGGYSYLKKALEQPPTEIKNGLILSSLISLGYNPTRSGFVTQSGLNGIYDATKPGGGIAFWSGGAMKDIAEDYPLPWDGNTPPRPENPSLYATSIIRMDGTVYHARGNFWIDLDGKVHCDPLSFFVGEDQVGEILTLFTPVKTGSAPNQKVAGIRQNYPFEDGTGKGRLYIGSHIISEDKDGILHLTKKDGSPASFYVTGGLSSKGYAEGSGGGGEGGGGLIQNVYGYTDLGKTYSNADLDNTFNAYTINQLATRITSLEGGSAMTFNTTGTGEFFSAVNKNGTTVTFTKSTPNYIKSSTTEKTIKPDTTGSGLLKLYFVNGSNVGLTGGYADALFLNGYIDNSAGGTNLITFDKRNGEMGLHYQSFNSTTWGARRVVLESSNYSNYTVTKTGGGASGTWGIDITGNANSATSLRDIRTIGISGGATGTATSFNGTSNITIPVTEIDPSKSYYENEKLLIKKIVAQYTSDSSEVTGIIKISLPSGWSATMMGIEIDVYDYSRNAYSKVLVGGYNYTTQAWYNTSVSILGNHGYNVRLGYDGSKCCILLGSTTYVWHYPKVVVRNVMSAFSGYMSLNGTWNTSVITTEAGLSAIVEPVVNNNMTVETSRTCSGNAATATNISNTGTVTLATAIESNAITITQPSYIGNQPVKLLNFNWHNDVWSIGNIRNYNATSAGLGIFEKGSEIAKFAINALHVPTLVIRSQNQVSHIKFTRPNLNYISCDTSGLIGFVTNGKDPNAANSDVIISGNMIYPGTNNLVINGTDANRWKGVYSVIGNFTGAVTAGAGLELTGSLKMMSDWIRFTKNSTGLYSEIGDARWLYNGTSWAADKAITSTSTITGTRLISNVAQGTAPLTVTSTTLVNNLNADLLDNYHASGLATANTVVIRDGNNYTYLKYINSSTNTDENGDLDQFIVTQPNDSFYRKYGRDYVRVRLNDFINNCKTLDLTSLDQDTYYPCSVTISAKEPTTINIFVSLNSGSKPSWSTHPSGFTMNLSWQVFGGGWGTTIIQRKIFNDYYSNTSNGIHPCGGIEQNAYASTEIVYLRGGAKYLYTISNSTSAIAINTNGYSWSSGSTTYSAPTMSAPKKHPSLCYEASSMLGASNIYANRLQVSSISVDGIVTATTYKSGKSMFQDGQLELSGTTPYIDFHYGNSTADYTHRIIAATANRMDITTNLQVNGVLSTNSAYLETSNPGFKTGNVIFRATNTNIAEISSYNAELIFSGGGTMAVNVRASGAGRTIPTKWNWHRGAANTWADFEIGALITHGNVTINGITSVNGNLDVVGDIGSTGGITSTRMLATLGGLDVTDNAMFNNDATFDGTTYFNDVMNINTAVTLNGDVALNGTIRGNSSSKIICDGIGISAGNKESGCIISGNPNAWSIVLDHNDIQARNNGAWSSLYINDYGGDVSITNSSATYSAKILSTKASTAYNNGALTVGGGVGVGGSVYVRNNVVVNGAVTAKEPSTSDIRLKDNIRDFNASLILKEIGKPFTFEWNSLARELNSNLSNEHQNFGVSAQRVKEVLPGFAFECYEGGYLGVKYERFMPIVMAAQLETMGEVEILKRRVKELEDEIKILKKEV